MIQWTCASISGWGLGYLSGFAVAASLGFTNRLATDVIFSGFVGAGFGFTQWLAVRRHVSHAHWWPATCVIGWTVGVFAGRLAVENLLDPDAHFVVGRAILGVSIGAFTGVCQWFVIRRTFSHGSRWILGSIAGFTVALIVHGLVIWAVGQGLVRELSAGIAQVAEWAPLILLPYMTGASAAVVAWSILRTRLPGAMWWSSAGLAYFWICWTLLEFGPGPQEIGTGVAVGLMAMAIGLVVGISTGVILVLLSKMQPARTSMEGPAD